MVSCNVVYDHAVLLELLVVAVTVVTKICVFCLPEIRNLVASRGPETGIARTWVVYCCFVISSSVIAVRSFYCGIRHVTSIAVSVSD